MAFGNYHFSTLIAALALLGSGCLGSGSSSDSDNSSNSNSPTHTWNFDGSRWAPKRDVPNCASPLQVPSPVDLNLVDGINNPGKYRGDDYKTHGLFAFDQYASNAVEVRAPLNAEVVNGVRYYQDGVLQYMFTFINECGISYRFDHLLELSPAFQAIAEKLPPPPTGDSRTTNIYNTTVNAGDLIATQVGMPSNYFLDYGVYDLRQPNEASQDPTWAALYSSELSHYGICWAEFFPEPDRTTALALPSRAGGTGEKITDYCD